MNDDEIQELTLMKRELDAERIRRMGIENDFQSSQMEQQNKLNIVEFQLDLNKELDRIYHLLKGDIIEIDADGNEKWKEPDDDRLKILSDYGVKQIMNIVYFYINKNTLLSNYDETTIYWKVRDFGIELSDLIFNRYEAFFSYPSVEELYKHSVDLIIKYPNEFKHLLNNEGIINADTLYQKCILWSKEELQSKLRHYPMIVLQLIDTIHSTYLRALNGEERESLRKQMSIIQSLSSGTQLDNARASKFSVFKPSTWK